MQRTIALEGCLNFRDLGGYPTADGGAVRWRTLYRSDALHRLTRADVDRLRHALGVASVIDLRSTGELRSEGRGPLADEPVAFHHLPLFDGDVKAPPDLRIETLADRYVLLAEFARARIAEILAALADAPGGVVYHCAAGKDRTGVVSAIVLGVLGVADETIVADYVATQENLDAIIDRLMSAEGYQKMLAALPPDTLHAEAATMETFLGTLRARHGSIADYVRGAGVDDATVARLRARLVE